VRNLEIRRGFLGLKDVRIKNSDAGVQIFRFEMPKLKFWIPVKKVIPAKAGI